MAKQIITITIDSDPKNKCPYELSGSPAIDCAYDTPEELLEAVEFIVKNGIPD